MAESNPNITFLGAAKTVTGSRHLLSFGGKQVLVDCGMFQGSSELRQRNWKDFEFEPSGLDAVVITHAHLDHIGLLPKLVREGYEGPIYATPATCDIAKISLPDSGRLQEEDAYHHNKHGSHHQPALPLYTEAEAIEAGKQFQAVHYEGSHDLPGGGSWKYQPAGHIIGSGYAEISLPNGETILMSGDLGRFNTPLIKDPTVIDRADYLVIESTYGDRLHPTADTKGELAGYVKDVWDTGATLIVPSFSIGRTQELLYYLFELEQAGQLPRIPIFVDSPMATSVTHVYAANREELDRETLRYLDEGKDPMKPSGLTFVRDRNQSKGLNTMQGPKIIIAGSGMANGGRVVHHLINRLPDPSTIVLFTGYQAVGTLGNLLENGAATAKIYGQEVPVRARIEKLSALSAHADQGEILKWLGGFKAAPKTTFIVHGEPPAQAALQQKIRETLGWDTVIPGHGDRFELGN